MSKGQVYAYQVDLTKREEIYRAAERVKQEVGKVCRLHFFVFLCSEYELRLSFTN